MAFATHGLIALCYAVLALVVGLALGPGGAVAIAGAVIYQAVVGARRHRELAAGLAGRNGAT